MVCPDRESDPQVERCLREQDVEGSFGAGYLNRESKLSRSRAR